MAFIGSRHSGSYGGIDSGHATRAAPDVNAANDSSNLTAGVSGSDQYSELNLARAPTFDGQEQKAWSWVRRQFREILPFWRALAANPRGVASPFPSSRALARCIAAQVDPTGSDLVLELGAGTGAVTSALLERGIDPNRLLVIEKDAELVKLLRERFPSIVVEHADALEVIDWLSESQVQLSAIVSGLPLLNFKYAIRRRLIEQSLQRLHPGAPFIQLSFAWKPPVVGEDSWLVGCAGLIVRSMPPATVWVYTHALNFAWEAAKHPALEN